MFRTAQPARSLLLAVVAVLMLTGALLVTAASQPARADDTFDCVGVHCPPDDPTTCNPADLGAAKQSAADAHADEIAAQTAAARSAQIAADAQADLAKADAKIKQQSHAITRLRAKLAAARS